MGGARVLVVGGAGFIGSVVADRLTQAGFQVENYDDLSSGYREAVCGPLHLGDVRDRDRLLQVLRAGRYDAVLHFAARIAVGESVREPALYYSVNVGGSIALLSAMLEAGVGALVFSSSAAVYGDPHVLPIPESHAFAPVSPYGHTKAMVEQILADTRAAGLIRAMTLRYFNAAGAPADGTRGEAHEPETHLIPLALDAAWGRRPALALFGDDYDTRDGTCVRDYIHVVDLADAHVLALRALLDGAPGAAYNVGTGTGHTVREVLEAVGQAVGQPVPVTVAPRRAGDPPALVAAAETIQRELGWAPRCSDLGHIVATAARWAAQPRYGPRAR